MVNGLGVGAFTRRNGTIAHAPYSCKGPGRECAKLKPDLVAFGGCDQEPIHLLSTDSGQKVLSYGTSFASPQVASLCGSATGVVDRGTALLSRALLLQGSIHPGGTPDHLFGHGYIPQSLDSILSCDAQKVSIIFQGSIIPTKRIRLPLMLPAGTVSSGKVKITWTVAALPSVSPKHPSDYTNCCIEDTFYPNSHIYIFTNKQLSGKVETKRLHLVDDRALVDELLAVGWRQSDFPAPESGNQYPATEDARRLDYKWEPIVRRHRSKLASSFHEPFLVLHAIPRNGMTGLLEYAAVVTIEATNHSGDLYDSILRRYSALQPVRLRSEAEIRIQI